MSTRILGNVPVFGSEAKTGKLQDASGTLYLKTNPKAFFTNNPVAYENGVDTVTPEIFNGAVNYLTDLIRYVYERGVPEYSLNVAYSKGALVSFKGTLYVSLVNNNVKHVSQTTHWGRYLIEPNDSIHNDIGYKENVHDSNPIGTILTVPNSTDMYGYIDYVPGQSFSSMVYPELFKILGTDTFAADCAITGVTDLPVGSLVHWLSATENVPDGYIEWTTSYGSLSKYPELYNVLVRMAESLPLGDSKTAWNEALRTYSLPPFEASGFYLGYGSQTGTYTSDTTRQEQLMMPPVVIDNSNSLNPLGYTKCLAEEETQSPVVAANLQKGNTESPYVIVGQNAAAYQSTDKNVRIATLGNASATAPKTLATRLLLKAVSLQSASISSTHKRIIKAY